MFEQGLLDILEEEIFQMFEIRDGGPLRPSEVKNELSVYLPVEEVRGLMDMMVDKGELVRLFYNQYTFPSKKVMATVAVLRDFMEDVLNWSDRSVIFFSNIHKKYFRVQDEKSLIDLDSRGKENSTFFMAGPAVEGVLKGEVYPVCSLCLTPEIHEVLPNYKAEKNEPLVCPDCMQFMNQMPEIESSDKLRRILYLFRVYRLSIIRDQYPDMYILYPTDVCIINFSLTQTMISLSW